MGSWGRLRVGLGGSRFSDCLVGISWLQGRFMGLDEPVVPLLRKRLLLHEFNSAFCANRVLANSDYQTGLVGAVAIMQALLARTKDDTTYDIDVSLTQYNISILQTWTVQRRTAERTAGAQRRLPGPPLRRHFHSHTENCHGSQADSSGVIEKSSELPGYVC